MNGCFLILSVCVYLLLYCSLASRYFRRKKKTKYYKTRAIIFKLPLCTTSKFLQILPLSKRFHEITRWFKWYCIFNLENKNRMYIL